MDDRDHFIEDVTRAAGIEYESLTKYQQHFHYSEGGDDSVRLRIGSKMVKSSWASHFTEQMSAPPSTETETTRTYAFEDNTKHDFLLSATFVQSLHAIRVKPEYKDIIYICWPKNIIHRIVFYCQLKFDKSDGPGFDSVFLDIHRQCIRKDPDSSITASYEREIGNILYLTDWNSFLPPHTGTISLPFTFDRDFLLGFPNFLMTKSVVIQMTIRNSLESLLRMGRRVDENTITDIVFDAKYLDNYSAVKKLPPPTLYGDYAKVEPRELDILKEEYKKRGEIIMEDIIMHNEANPSGFGKQEDIKLSHTFPAHYAIVVAENSKSSSNRNFSNYSTDPDDPSKGYSPIQSVSLIYGSHVKIPHLPTPFYTHVYPRKYFGKVADEPGYAVVPIGFKGSDFVMDTTVVPEEVKMHLHVKLANTDPMFLSGVDASAASRIDEPQDDGASEISTVAASTSYRSHGLTFRIKVRLCVYKRYKLVDGTFVLLDGKSIKD